MKELKALYGVQLWELMLPPGEMHQGRVLINCKVSVAIKSNFAESYIKISRTC